MTRAKDISKILTDANISGTLDVSGAFTSQGIDDNADATAITITSDEKVGVNATSPARQFTVQNTIANSGGELGILSSDSSTTGAFGTIHFGNNTDTSLASIRAKADGSTTSGKLEFNTEPNGGAIETRMTIDSSGNVGIGQTSNLARLTVNSGATNASATFISSDAGAYIGFADNSTTLDSGTFPYVFTGAVGNDYIIGTNNSERMRIDSSGNVGIGNTAMSSLNSEANNLVVGTGSGSEGITIYTGSSAGHYGSIFFADGTDSNAEKRGQIRYEHNNEIMSFYTNVTERMRIHSSGQVGIGQTANEATLCIFGHQQAYTGLQIKNGTNNGSTLFAVFKRSNGTATGSIQQSADGATTAFNTTSDYRLKESISYDFDATTRLKQLKPCRFVFKESLTGQTVDGFLAHEVSSAVPEAVSGTKDEIDADGNAKYQSIDHSRLVPLLVKTIQELEARITALEGA